MPNFKIPEAEHGQPPLANEQNNRNEIDSKSELSLDEEDVRPPSPGPLISSQAANEPAEFNQGLDLGQQIQKMHPMRRMK